VGAALVARALQPEVIQSVDAIPAHIAGRFRDPTGLQQSASGQYFVADALDGSVAAALSRRRASSSDPADERS
jgi:hypothetical protein